jgi:hypothetical protein
VEECILPLTILCSRAKDREALDTILRLRQGADTILLVLVWEVIRVELAWVAGRPIRSEDSGMETLFE